MTEAKTFDLYGFGIAAVDDLLEVESFPVEGTKEPVLSRRRQGGGLCTTALVAAARLGLRCRYDGLLGDNELSDFVRQGLRAEGIDFEESVRYPDAQPFHSTIIVNRSSGERTILSGSEGVAPPSPRDIREDRLRASRALFVDHLGPEGVRRACEMARRHGVPTVADVERVSPQLAPVLPLMDHLIMPLRVAREYTQVQTPEAAVAQLARAPRACTAVTDGVHGCWYLEQGSENVRHQGAFEVPAVDTTGCGDVFHGAYAAGVVWGWPVPRIVAFAAAAAALAATRPGAQAGAPGLESVERFLAERRTPLEDLSWTELP